MTLAATAAMAQSQQYLQPLPNGGYAIQRDGPAGYGTYGTVTPNTSGGYSIQQNGPAGYRTYGTIQPHPSGGYIINQPYGR